MANYTYGQGLLDVNATGNSDSTGWLTGTGASAAAATGWYLGDGQGNVAQVATGAGDIVTQTAVDPWGATDVGVGTWGAPAFGYQLQLSDPGVGLQYLRARWYEPGMGRFISADSSMGAVSNPLSLNRYTYAWSDPVNMSDPSGYWPAWLNNAVSAVGSAVASAAHAVASAVTTAATWVNSNVVQLVVSAVKTGASWVNNNVIKPVARGVSNGVGAIVNTAVSIAEQAKTQVGAFASAAVIL